MHEAVDAERGTLIASPVLLCLVEVTSSLLPSSPVFFAAAFLAAFFVAICLFSLVIRHRLCNSFIAANEGIDS